MGTLEILAQGFGIFGMVFMILSYQVKSQRGLITVQLFGAAFFFLNFLFLGIAQNTILAGMLLNVIGILRCIVFTNKERFHAEKSIWLFGFILSYILTYVLMFTLLGVEPNAKNLVVEFLPVVGMTASNIAFFKSDARSVRLFGFIASPAWLIYDVVRFTLGGVITEVLSLVSIVIGLIRYDIKKREPEDLT